MTQHHASKASEVSLRNRRIRILHEGHEYFLVDRGQVSSSRVITILKRAEQEEEQGAGAVRVLTDIGDCVAVANWSKGRVRMEPGHESLGPVFREIVERYLEEFRVGKQTENTKRYYFLSRDGLPLYTLSGSQPAGLTVLVFSSEEAAEQTLSELREEGPARIEAVGDLTDFLAARATEGLAGALLDGRDPIYFCADENGVPGYLRVALNEDRGDLEYSLLGPDGLWGTYDGEQELTPGDDQDLFDEYMLERLGDLPFLGHGERTRYQTLAKGDAPDRPAVIELGEDLGTAGRPFCPIFHDPDQAQTFLEDHGLEGYRLIPVKDLMELAREMSGDDCMLLLQPGGHRAASGALWQSGDRLILDSFSGFWQTRDGRRFIHE